MVEQNINRIKKFQYKCLDKFRQSVDTADLEIYLQSKRDFKKEWSIKQKEYDNKTINELVEKPNDRNPKAFCNT